MPALCSRSWAETVEQGHRNPSATMTLHHRCILHRDHQDHESRPTPCHCACDPVFELRVDFVEFVRGGVWRRP
mgnify:CR=1 FL=1